MIKHLFALGRVGLYFAVAVASQTACAQPVLRRMTTTPQAVELRSIPAVNLDKAQAERMDWMAGQIAALERQVAEDKEGLEALRAELAIIKMPPKGYTRSFITKFNWDSLDPSDGIFYYPRIK